MKAFILAAGLGTRLHPVTIDVPKCLVPIAGKPLLQIWLELLGSYGVEEALINTHYLSEMVQDFSASWSGVPKLRLSQETELLGSAGTLKRNWNFVAKEESFLVCYADNLTDINLTKLTGFHQRHCGLVTMALFRSERPKECGIAEMDDSGRIISFEEKPAVPKSSFANGGIYLMRTGIHAYLPRMKPSDIGFDLLPRCLGQMYGWLWEGLLFDIGNPESYLLAQKEWAAREN